MYYSPIDLPTPIDAQADQNVGRMLAILAAGLDARFVQAGTTLTTAVETIDRVVAALDTITGALDETSAVAAIRDLKAIANRLVALPEEQAARAAELAQIGTASAALRAGVMKMHQSLYVLHLYGMNIKIAAAAEATFVVFVDGMATKLDVGRQLLDGLLAQLKELAGGVTGMGQTGRLLAKECAMVVPHVPHKLAEDAAALDAYLRGLADVARRVADIARAVQGQVGIALGTLQVGDSTRQRLEHVVTGLQILETRMAQADAAAAADPAVGAIVRHLLARQLDATATAFEDEAARLVASLRGLMPQADQLLGLIDRQANGEGRAFLGQLEQGIGEVASVTAQLGRAEERARAMTGVVSATVTDLTGRLQQIRRVRVDVQDIATNTRLLCRRQGNVGKAVSVIAAEIDVQAHMLGVAMDDVLRPIDMLTAVSQSMQIGTATQGIDIDQALAAALDVIRKGCLDTEQAIGAGGDDARQLIQLLDGAADDLAQQLALTGHVREAAVTLDGAPPPGAPTEAGAALLRAMLPQIHALYTMAAEREVHADALPPEFAPPPPAAAVIDDDDDDDGLF